MSCAPLPAGGFCASWQTWDGSGDETLTLTWENEAWTASGIVSRERLQYVLRLSPSWSVRQFLLFRDLDEPDLWLATDGGGRWGEVNGAHRTDLDGCIDIRLVCTPFTHTLPIRRLPLRRGDSADVLVAAVDTVTLGVDVESHRYERCDDRTWRHHRRARTGAAPADVAISFDVDEYGLVVDYPGWFRRSA